MSRRSVTINYELLRTFLDVGRSTTFAAAAERQHVTPSAVSQKIKALEAQLGVALFERIGKRVRLNETGHALLGSLEHHLPAVDAVLDQIGETKDCVRGVIRIGAPRPFAAYWLRPRLIALLESYEELAVTVRFDGPSALRRALIEGECDLCIMVADPDHAGLEHEVIHTEEFVAIANPKYLKRYGTPSDAHDFREHRYIVFDDDLPMHAAWWRAAFGPREPPPVRIAARVASLDEMSAMACAGVGIAVLPSYFVEGCLATGKAIALSPREDQNPKRKRVARNAIYLAWRKDAALTPRFQAARSALLGKKRNP